MVSSYSLLLPYMKAILPTLHLSLFWLHFVKVAQRMLPILLLLVLSFYLIAPRRTTYGFTVSPRSQCSHRLWAKAVIRFSSSCSHDIFRGIRGSFLLLHSTKLGYCRNSDSLPYNIRHRPRRMAMTNLVETAPCSLGKLFRLLLPLMSSSNCAP